MRTHSLRLWPVALLMVLATTPVFAQGTATSSITGVVVDADGGFVPGATVLVKSEAPARNSRRSAGRTASSPCRR